MPRTHFQPRQPKRRRYSSAEPGDSTTPLASAAEGTTAAPSANNNEFTEQPEGPVGVAQLAEHTGHSYVPQQPSSPVKQSATTLSSTSSHLAPLAAGQLGASWGGVGSHPHGSALTAPIDPSLLSSASSWSTGGAREGSSSANGFGGGLSGQVQSQRVEDEIERFLELEAGQQRGQEAQSSPGTLRRATAKGKGKETATAGE